jgi:hypothetical protein
MEALHGKHLPSKDEIRLNEAETIEEFESKLREENIRLLRNLRLKEMMIKAKSNDPALEPLK